MIKEVYCEICFKVESILCEDILICPACANDFHLSCVEGINTHCPVCNSPALTPVEFPPSTACPSCDEVVGDEAHGYCRSCKSKTHINCLNDANRANRMCSYCYQPGLYLLNRQVS
ncbi:MAG: hypothetical protein ACXAE3_14780 [Candidatus Kariarchaeaceae archaeon]